MEHMKTAGAQIHDTAILIEPLSNPRLRPMTRKSAAVSSDFLVNQTRAIMDARVRKE